MKLVTKKEWENTPKERKRIYERTAYMLYIECDGTICFGPVKIVEEGNIINFKKHSHITSG